MRIPYLGKIRLRHCDHCNLPVLAKKCGICNNMTREVIITPPGDARPIFEKEFDLINQVIQNLFGSAVTTEIINALRKRIVLLNKAPYEDRMDEIIVEGTVIGVIRFDLIRDKLEFHPRLDISPWIHSKPRITDFKRWVLVDPDLKKLLAKSKVSILAPGVLQADPNIEVDDPVFIFCKDEIIATGLAKMTGSEMNKARSKGTRGVAVKVKSYKFRNPVCSILRGKKTWFQVLRANENVINDFEREAIQFIRRTNKEFDLRPVVAYSGGKDSLAVLLLALDAINCRDIIFADTGLEFPETLENINLVKKELNLNVFKETASIEEFWKRFHQFGPPSRSTRYCCKRSKLTPINQIIENAFPSGILTFIGRRRYESLSRSREMRVSKNPWIPKQTMAAPIRNWTALHVFLYIKSKKAEHLLNPIYNSVGLARIGCWLCPASNQADLRLIAEAYPHLNQELESHLEQWELKMGYPSFWRSLALWRWKMVPKKILDRLEKANIPFSPQLFDSKVPISFEITTMPSPCKEGGITLTCQASYPLDLARISLLIPIIGKTNQNTSLGVLFIRSRKNSIQIYADGTIIARGENIEDLKNILAMTIGVIVRSEHCDHCKTCFAQCSQNALLFDEETKGIKVNEKLCRNCTKCTEYCPTWKYDYRMIRENILALSKSIATN
ncbi:MAG: phosphoadenosine phosphosulfate reductase family protein [Promethearchaeota archaeon]